MWIAASAIVGFVLGFIVCKVMFREHLIGNLRVDHSDEEPYIFLETSKKIGLEKIEHSKFVLLNVVVQDYISRE